MTAQTSYFTSGNRTSANHQSRLNRAYAVAGIPEAAPIVDLGSLVDSAIAARVKTSKTIAAELFAAITDVDSVESAVDAALADAAILAAVSAVRQDVNLHAYQHTPVRWARASADVALDLEPCAKKTIAALKRAAAKLEGIADPFDSDELLAKEADLKAVSIVREALTTLGTLVAAVDQPAAENAKYPILRAARFVSVPLDLESNPLHWATRSNLIDPDPATKSLRALFYDRAASLDVVLYRIAAGHYPGLDLAWTADRETVDTRIASVHAAMTDRVVRDESELNALGHETRRRLGTRFL